MTNLNDDIKRKLISRVKEKALREEQGDAIALFDFILPELREQENKDLILQDIESYVHKINSAEVKRIKVVEYCEAMERYSNCPSALVRSIVLYNGERESYYRTIWVYNSGQWYSTAFSKVDFGR